MSRLSDCMDLITRARRLHVRPPRRKFLLNILAQHSDPDGTNCFPSIDTLMTEVGTDRRSIQRDLRALENEGWIECAVQDSGRGKPRGYRLKIPAGKGQQIRMEMGGTETADKNGKKGGTSDPERAGLDPEKGGKTASHIRNTVNYRNKPIPDIYRRGSGALGMDDEHPKVSEIAEAHPRYIHKVETHRVISDEIFRLVDSGMAEEAATDLLLVRTKLYRQKTDQWPPGQRQHIVGSVRWYSTRCYEEDEINWERLSDEKHQGNGGRSKGGAYHSGEPGKYDDPPDFSFAV